MFETIMWKQASALAIMIVNEPLGLLIMGMMVLLFCLMKFRKQSEMNKELWKFARDAKESLNDKIETNSIDIATHDNRLQMQSDHFDVLDKDMNRAKESSQNALNLCFKMVKHISSSK